MGFEGTLAIGLFDLLNGTTGSETQALEAMHGVVATATIEYNSA